MAQEATQTEAAAPEQTAAPVESSSGREYLYPSDAETAISDAVSAAPKEEPTQTGEGEAAKAAPPSGEGEAAKEPKAEDATPKQGKEAEEAATATTEPKAEDLLAALSPVESPEQKAARLEKQYSASTKEALRLKGVNESVVDQLAEQKIEVITDNDGKVLGLAPMKGYTPEADVSIKFDDLSSSVQELMADDPQKFVDTILDKAKSSLVRVAPTVENAVKPISPEQIASIESFMKEAKNPDGTPIFDGFEENTAFGDQKANLIRQFLEGPTQKKAVKDFFNTDPTSAMEYANLKLQAAKASYQRTAQSAINAQKKKEQESADTLHPGPDAGGGSANLSTGGESVDAIGKRMAKQIASARY